MADQLCTTAQVKARLDISDATDDTLLSELIDEATEWIQGYTGRKFVADAGATYTFDTQAGYVLRIPRGIRTITSMGVATTHQPDSGGTYTTIPAADRLLRPKAEIVTGAAWPFMEVWLFRGTLTGTISRFVTAQNGCTITGDFGFAAVPPDIQGVAIDAVVAGKQALGDGASSAIGADGMAIPPWNRFFGAGSPQMKILNSYREWRVA